MLHFAASASTLPFLVQMLYMLTRKLRFIFSQIVNDCDLQFQGQII